MRSFRVINEQLVSTWLLPLASFAGVLLASPLARAAAPYTAPDESPALAQGAVESAPPQALEETPDESPFADEGTSETPRSAHEPSDARTGVPIVAYTYSAAGAPAKSVGVQAYGLGLAASGQKTTLGGGGTIWGSPVDRLTLIGDAQRNISGNFSPSAAITFRILGDRDRGWSLAGLGKFKIDGFASGPNHDEIESELELGALVSFAQQGWHFDANGIGGRGTGDDGETDVEGRLRLGKDLGRFFRVGFDSQARVRAAGPKYLPNGRIWDFAAGAQAFAALGEFFGSVTAGPATMGLTSRDVGWTAIASFGGLTL